MTAWYCIYGSQNILNLATTNVVLPIFKLTFHEW